MKKKILIISIIICLLGGIVAYGVYIFPKDKETTQKTILDKSKEVESENIEAADESFDEIEEINDNETTEKPKTEEKKDSSQNNSSSSSNSNSNTSGNNNLNTPTKPQLNNFTVSFNSSGGSGVSSQTVVENSYANRPNNPTKYGYVLKNWLLNGSVFDFSKPITTNITLIAEWKVDEVPLLAWYKKDFNTEAECDSYADKHFAGTYWYYCTPIKNYANINYGFMLRLFPFNDPNGTEVDLRPYK